MQDDVQAIGSAKAFVIDTAATGTTRIGTRLVESPDVATRNVVAAHVGFFKFADIHAVLATLDFFNQHINATVNTVDIQVKMLGTGTIAARLPKKPMRKRITKHALVYIRPMQHPVIRRGQPEHTDIGPFTLFITDFDTVAGLGEQGRRLAPHLDADVVRSTACTVGHVVRLAIQHLHGGGNFFGHLVVEALALGIHENNRQVVSLRKRK